MTQIHKSIALALMATYQQHVVKAGNEHCTIELGKYQVTLNVFAHSLSETNRYRRILLNLGVCKKDIEYGFFPHDNTDQDFHLISYSIEFE